MLAFPVAIRSALSVLLASSIAAVLALPAVAQEQHPIQPPQKRLVADYQYGSQFSDPPYSSAQIPFHKITHIIHCRSSL